jgi:hypothetical protein
MLDSNSRLERLELLLYIHASLPIRIPICSIAYSAPHSMFLPSAVEWCHGFPLSSTNPEPTKETSEREQTPSTRGIRVVDRCCYEEIWLDSITTIITTADALAARCNVQWWPSAYSWRTLFRVLHRRVGESKFGACLDILRSAYDSASPDHRQKGHAQYWNRIFPRRVPNIMGLIGTGKEHETMI